MVLEEETANRGPNIEKNDTGTIPRRFMKKMSKVSPKRKDDHFGVCQTYPRLKIKS